MILSRIILSSAYFPPVHYTALLFHSGKILIEYHENYIKQTYRNRCRIASANGPLTLSVPVMLGSFHKTAIKDIRIDYSRRWQQVHLGAIISSYRASPYFEYYFDRIEQIIMKHHSFLTDLNMETNAFILSALGLEREVSYTSSFLRPEGASEDLRYSITPKNESAVMLKDLPEYRQVFHERYGFIAGLSSIDLILNAGPDATLYLTYPRHLCRSEF